jgi:hypothetical protein
MQLEMYQVCISFYSILNVRIEVQIMWKEVQFRNYKIECLPYGL